jgi:transposase
MGFMGTSALPPKDWREGRRLRAWELHQHGWKQKDIAAALGVSPGAVSQWLARGRDGGGESLRHRPPPGAPARLTAEQQALLPTLLAQGAEAFGFRGNIWTTARVAALIKRAFNVAYHPAHVSRLLRAIGWSVQQPIERASQRDEAAIRTWREQRWPALKKRRPRKAVPSYG